MQTVEQIIGPPKDIYMHTALVQCTDSRAVGIELELEHVSGYELPSTEEKYNLLEHAPGWAIKKDNSLRNHGAEFISLPSGVNGILEKLILLFAAPHSKHWKTSSRTGLHVHVNVRDFTWQDVRALAATYCLIEPALFAFVGKEREENIFCVPYYRTPKSVMNFSALQTDMPMSEALHSLHQGWCKYTALHLAPMYKLGSVEFRHAPSWLDPYKIAQWARMCESVVSYAKGKTAKQVISEWDSNWSGFVNKFTSWSPGYYQTVQKLDCDLLANMIAGLEVSPDAWAPKSGWEDEWESKVYKSSSKKHIGQQIKITPSDFDSVPMVVDDFQPLYKSKTWPSSPPKPPAGSPINTKYFDMYNKSLQQQSIETQQALLKKLKASVVKKGS